MPTHSTTIERDDEELEIIVEYTAHRACRGATDGRYGPPIEPDDPGGIEIDGVRLDVPGGKGDYIDLTDDELDSLYEDINDYLGDQSAFAEEYYDND